MDEDDSIRQCNAQLRYYFRIDDPDSLSDEDWAARIKELEWIRTAENKNR